MRRFTSKHIRATQKAYAEGYTVTAPTRLVDVSGENEFGGMFSGRDDADNYD